MKKTLVCIYRLVMLTGLCLASNVMAQDAASWQRVSPADEAFAVMMPGTPLTSAQKYQMGQMNVSGKLYAVINYAAVKEAATYRVWSLKGEGRSNYSYLNPDAYLDACADLVWESLLKADRSKVEESKTKYSHMDYRRELEFRAYPGREYYIALGGVPGVVHFYVIDQQIYVLVITRPGNDSAVTEQFLGSFTYTMPIAGPIEADPTFFPPDVRNLPYGIPNQRGTATGIGTGTGPGTGGNTGAQASAGNIDYNRPFNPREVTQKARVLSRPEPRYTQSARRYSVSGTVVLKAIFSSTGEVTNIRAAMKLPHGLTEEAIRAARQMRFTPAIKDGRPVSQYIQIEYHFKLY